MKSLRLVRVVAIAALALSAMTVSAAPPDNGGGGGPQMGGRGGGPPPFMNMMDRNQLSRTIATLGELNLSPDFTLSADQKQKLEAIRADFKKQQDQWKTDHAADLKASDDAINDLRDNGGPPDRDQMRSLFEARMKIMSTAPDGADAVKQVIALLTPDQAKQLQAKQDELDAQRQAMRDQFGGPGGGRGGPGGGGPPDGGGPPGGGPDNGGGGGSGNGGRGGGI
jgi:hypothetical protein